MFSTANIEWKRKDGENKGFVQLSLACILNNISFGQQYNF